tara:strand:+ start:304 stop:501 length:198 start_codon:yes stop_codon:yes gene_type:complete
MPFVKVDIWEGRSDEEKEKIIKGITDVFVRELKMPKEWVQVLISDNPRSNWGINGEQASKLHPEE